MENKANLVLKEIPHKVLHFASAWWRRNIAPIRQEHIFVRILFAITVFFILCFLIVLSYSLLGEEHPFANDAMLSSVVYNLGVCFSGTDGLELYVARYLFMMAAGLINMPPFVPYYLLFIYVLAKVTGYNEIKGKNFVAIYFIFGIILFIGMAGWFIGLVYLGEIFSFFIPDWAFVEKVFYDFKGRNPFRSRGKIFESDCSWSYAIVVIGLIMPLFIAILLSFYIIKWFYSEKMLVYRCIYLSLVLYSGVYMPLLFLFFLLFDSGRLP